MIALKSFTILLCLILGAFVDGHSNPETNLATTVAETVCFEDQVVVQIIGVWHETDHVSSGGPDAELLDAVACVALDEAYDPFGDPYEMEPLRKGN